MQLRTTKNVYVTSRRRREDDTFRFESIFFLVSGLSPFNKEVLYVDSTL